MSFVLTEKALMEMAGWKVMKEARGLWRAGAVTEARWRDGILEGKIRGAGPKGVAKARVKSASDVETECGCLIARRFGTVCEHVVAVGLEVISPTHKKEEISSSSVEVAEVSADWPRWTVEEKTGARPVRLRVLLPLPLAKSWESGKLLVGVEVEDGETGEAMMLSGMKGELLFVSEEDAGVLEVLKGISPQEVPGVGFLKRGEFLDLLEGLGGHGRVGLGKRESFQIGTHNVRLPLRVDSGRVVGVDSGRVVGVDFGRAWALVDGARGWVGEEGRVSPVAMGLREDLAKALFGMGLTLLEAGKRRDELARYFDLEAVEADLPVVLRPVVRVALEGSLNHLEAEVSFFYDESSREFSRDEVAEREVGAFLRKWGFEKKGKLGESGARWVVEEKSEVVRFHAYGRREMPESWVVQEGERYRHAASQVVEVMPEVEVRGSGEDWFGVSVGYRSSNGNALNAAEVRRIFQGGDGGQRTLPDGRVVVMEERVAREVEELQRDLEGEQVGGVMRVSAAQAGYLREAVREGVVKAAGEWPEEEAWDWDLGEGGMLLRPYQRIGTEWMLRLAELGMGGILADDMGLGKTLQTLCFLHATGGQSLVVCPSSLVGNWVAEAAKFFPTMKIVAIEGPKRLATLKEKGMQADVLVTSYALLRLDERVWREWGFTAIILDEAQTIKNPDAQVSKAAFALSGERRFALTGTPVENSVKDLWSVMRFVQPGYLGKRADFVERYEKPLSKGNEPALRARLGRRLRPLMLRRLKSEVATELPAKIEQVRYVELGKRQREVYEAILRESRSRVSDAQGGTKRMVALTSLLRLRQACCDLRLTGLEGEDEGAKIGVLAELLDEAIAGGHRVLVFSQFVKFLQAIVPMLMERDWTYSYLDGSTRDRSAVVRRFQENEEIPVFLISLKAGGVGLNLTGADTVIHVDPWWNPAVEAQATDRAYRIGQSRVVTSYKLIARGTVEEKILTLQEKKRALIDALVEGGEVGAGLTEDEVMGILEIQPESDLG